MKKQMAYNNSLPLFVLGNMLTDSYVCLHKEIVADFHTTDKVNKTYPGSRINGHIMPRCKIMLALN